MCICNVHLTNLLEKLLLRIDTDRSVQYSIINGTKSIGICWGSIKSEQQTNIPLFMSLLFCNLIGLNCFLLFQDKYVIFCLVFQCIAVCQNAIASVFSTPEDAAVFDAISAYVMVGVLIFVHLVAVIYIFIVVNGVVFSYQGLSKIFKIFKIFIIFRDY